MLWIHWSLNTGRLHLRSWGLVQTSQKMCLPEPGGTRLTVLYLIIKEREKSYKAVYRWTNCIHWTIFTANSSLTLNWRNLNSWAKDLLNLSTVGTSFSNIQSFLHFQMLHTDNMIISRAQLCRSCLVSLVTALWGQDTLGGMRPMDSQHLVAKLHLRNRW